MLATGAAAAAQPQVALAMSMNVRAMAAGATEGKIVRVTFGTVAGPMPPEVTVVVDGSDAVDSLSITVLDNPPGCAEAAGVITCVVSSPFREYDRNTLRLLFRPTPAARPGTTVPIATSISAPGALGQETAGDFALTGPRPDFSATTITVDNVAPGSSNPLHPSFRNAGDDAATGFTLRLNYFEEATLEGEYSNCYYSDAAVTCPFLDHPVQPGEVVTVSAATPFVLRPALWVPGLSTVQFSYEVEPVPAGTGFDPGQARRGNGPPLQVDTTVTLVETAVTTLADSPDADPVDNVGYLQLRIGANPADLAAATTSIEGSPGEVAWLTVRITNHGRAQIIGPEGLDEQYDDPSWPSLTIDIPAGVRVLQPQCRDYTGDTVGDLVPGATRYRCFFLSFSSGHSHTRRFQVEILSDQHSTGLVTARGSTLDPVPGNDTAIIHVNRPDGDGGGSGGLPITGDRTSTYALAGAGLLTLGLVLLLLTRRRAHPPPA
jgi:LPXTG-motif cell wall-anchored protein